MTNDETNREDISTVNSRGSSIGGGGGGGGGGVGSGNNTDDRRRRSGAVPTNASTSSGGGVGGGGVPPRQSQPRRRRDNNNVSMRSTGSATSSVTTTTSSLRRRPSNNSLDDSQYDDDNDDQNEREDEVGGGGGGGGGGGYVASRYRTPSGRRPGTAGGTAGSRSTNRNNSSWAKDNTRRLRSEQSILRYPDPVTGSPSGQAAVNLDDISLPSGIDNPGGEDRSSFKGWLAGSLFGALNAAAGITLSATGKVASPALGITQNVILPSVLEYVVDTLDVVTPPFVKDWFRILSSSVYHLYSVLASTSQGKVVRKQLLLVVQSILEAWSAPESRQVVVDGMAAGIKLVDALHTPEMLVFLEQTSVLGCRVVDALSSGKAKQLIHNSKDLVWNGIELAVDPATTVALAEITAHLCHALEETADSITYLESKGSRKGRSGRTATTVTSRQTRDGQNKSTYLYPNQITDYQAECIENVILSSLGVESYSNRAIANEGTTAEGLADDNNDDDITVTTDRRSVASNADLPGDISKSNENEQNPLWTSREDSVNVDLLRERILQEGRPRSRPSMRLSGEAIAGLPDSRIGHPDHEETDFSNELQDKQVEDDLRRLLDLEEVPGVGRRDDLGAPVHNQKRSDTTYIRDVNDKLEAFRSMQADNTKELSGAAQFYQLVDTYMQKDRLPMETPENAITPADFTIDTNNNDQEDLDEARTKLLQARVRKLKEGRVQRERLRKSREEHSKSRQAWKYPPVVVNIIILLVAGTILFWTSFGLYGLYTVSQVVYYKGVSVSHLLFPTMVNNNHPGGGHGDTIVPPLGSTSQTHSNEMVIRIVREVVHVREDGSPIDGYTGSLGGSSAAASFSKEEMDSVMECVAAIEEKSSSTTGRDKTETDKNNKNKKRDQTNNNQKEEKKKKK